MNILSKIEQLREHLRDAERERDNLEEELEEIENSIEQYENEISSLEQLEESGEEEYETVGLGDGVQWPRYYININGTMTLLIDSAHVQSHASKMSGGMTVQQLRKMRISRGEEESEMKVFKLRARDHFKFEETLVSIRI